MSKKVHTIGEARLKRIPRPTLAEVQARAFEEIRKKVAEMKAQAPSKAHPDESPCVENVVRGPWGRS